MQTVNPFQRLFAAQVCQCNGQGKRVPPSSQSLSGRVSPDSQSPRDCRLATRFDKGFGNAGKGSGGGAQEGRICFGAGKRSASIGRCDCNRHETVFGRIRRTTKPLACSSI